MQKKIYLIFSLVLLVVGFQSCTPAPEQDSSATTTTYPPQPLADRPVDLALYGADELDAHVSFESDRDPTGDFGTLWAAADTESELPVYWSAKVPVTLTIDLAEAAHINTIVVQPFTRQLGVGALDVEVIASDGTVHPITKFRPERDQNETFDAPADALSFASSPRVAQQVQLRFTRGTSEHPERVYLKAVRILGTAPHTPHIDTTEQPPPVVNEDTRINVASFTMEDIEARVRVSEDKRPNGGYAFPWVVNEDALPASNPEGAYWCATSPSWVSVDLGGPCVVDEVRVTPFDTTHGFSSLYVKIVGEDGHEYDSIPPATFTFSQNTGDANSEPEARLQFAPVKAVGLKIYLTGAEKENALTYVRHIEILGPPEAFAEPESSDSEA